MQLTQNLHTPNRIGCKMLTPTHTHTLTRARAHTHTANRADGDHFVGKFVAFRRQELTRAQLPHNSTLMRTTCKFNRNMDYSYHVNYTVERQLWQDTLVNRLVQNGLHALQPTKTMEPKKTEQPRQDHISLNLCQNLRCSLWPPGQNDKTTLG